MSSNIDFEKALSELRSGKDLTDEDGVLMLLIKQINGFIQLHSKVA